jgi:hypothetical protein
MPVAGIYDVLKQLRADLARVNYLIRLLENMVQGRKQRGRPPKFLNGSPDRIQGARLRRLSGGR